ncbi:uncharacterized protein L199_008001 [Kwoniella botswanensis]|uniref:uncharacterized protein n=1 Tax=Kwoniella botswanensis TaxID=1268659 RepID=UPI00315DAD80
MSQYLSQTSHSAEKHLQATRDGVHEWLPRWQSTCCDGTIPEDMPFADKLNRIVWSESASRAHLIGESSAPEVSGFQKTRSIPNPLLDSIKESRTHSLSTELLQSWRDLRVNILPPYLKRSYARERLVSEIIEPIGDNFKEELKLHCSDFSKEKRWKIENLVSQEQMKTTMEICSSIFGRDDEHRERASSAWQSLSEMIKQENESRFTDPKDFLCLPPLYPRAAEATMLLDQPLSRSEADRILDRGPGILQNMESHILECEQDSRRATELAERRQRLGEMKSLVNYAYTVDSHEGGQRATIEIAISWPISRDDAATPDCGSDSSDDDEEDPSDMPIHKSRRTSIDQTSKDKDPVANTQLTSLITGILSGPDSVPEDPLADLRARLARLASNPSVTEKREERQPVLAPQFHI